eukprot:1450112-Lingulodinium_polyedra.AAC.1
MSVAEGTPGSRPCWPRCWPTAKTAPPMACSIPRQRPNPKGLPSQRNPPSPKRLPREPPEPFQ